MRRDSEFVGALFNELFNKNYEQYFSSLSKADKLRHRSVCEGQECAEQAQ